MPIATPETLLREAAKYAQQRVAAYIEMLAAAYIKKTKLPPERAVMCYKFDYETGEVRVWFEEKQDIGDTPMTPPVPQEVSELGPMPAWVDGWNAGYEAAKGGGK